MIKMSNYLLWKRATIHPKKVNKILRLNLELKPNDCILIPFLLTFVRRENLESGATVQMRLKDARGGGGVKNVLSLVKLKGQERQRGMKVFSCLNE